ncbi:hypothetical protein AGOR_G00234840 [Albula goreensis]|uniref:Uncharacterized protein n=1 Tax=Albula goreensis TaxID=1534307 RepID=A0A8T3CMG7_9TELE|nr:hypothetical protein AGOR_G00234840 [Albula goreensis]
MYVLPGHFRKLEQEHREKLAALAEFNKGMDHIWEQANLQHKELESEIERMKKDKTLLRDFLSHIVKDLWAQMEHKVQEYHHKLEGQGAAPGDQQRELLLLYQREVQVLQKEVSGAENQVQELQKQLEQVCGSKDLSVDQACAVSGADKLQSENETLHEELSDCVAKVSKLSTVACQLSHLLQTTLLEKDVFKQDEMLLYKQLMMLLQTLMNAIDMFQAQETAFNTSGDQDQLKNSEGGDGPSDSTPKALGIWGKTAAIACAGVGAVGAVAMVPVALGAVGFTAGGIAAGSMAASMMSSAAIANGGGVAAGSLVAVLQSTAAAGMAGTTTAAVASAGGAVGLATKKMLEGLFSRK